MKRTETSIVIESARIVLLAAAWLLAASAAAVDSTFTYQGELSDNGTPVDGTVDVNFTLFDAATGGGILQEVMLVDVAVDDGRFTVELPFDRAHFDGSERFLELAVANPAGGSFEVLDPRQRISPAPYAIFADDAPGTDIDPSDFWSTAGNAAAAGEFLGTTNTTPLELRVNGVRVLQVADEIDSGTGVHAPNWTAGSEANVLGSGIVGATIGGGGGDPDNGNCGPDNNSPCVNTVADDYATVVGGFGNYATGSRSTAMGRATTASGTDSTAMGSGTIASGLNSTAMGSITTASEGNSTAMGFGTTASGGSSTALGYFTTAGGSVSTAMGADAEAAHDHTFVWSDGSGDDPFATSGTGQFLVRAAGGVGIGTNAPSSPLTVAGAIESTSDGFRFPDGSIQTTAADNGSSIDPSDFWSTAGNAAAAGDFLGTTNITPLELRVNGVRVLQVADRIDSGTGVRAPNWTAGSEANVLVFDTFGATIGGGGGNPDNNNCGPDNNLPCVNTVAGDYATVVGGFGNYATGFRSTAMGSFTTASGNRSTAMGNGTTASGLFSTAMGNGTTASGSRSTAMGSGTTASGDNSTAMGSGTTASGDNSTSMGFGTTASGDRSMAMGTGAIAGHDGTFVWADTTTANSFASTGEDQFLVRAVGGVGVGEDAPLAAFHVTDDESALGGDDGVADSALNNDDVIVEDADAVLGLYSSDDGARGSVINLGEVDAGALTDVWHVGRKTSGSGSSLFFRFGTSSGLNSGDEVMVLETNGDLSIDGTLNQSSDRNRKENIQPADTTAILEQLAALPINRWNYIDDPADTPHVGPMAQDFHAAFGVGTDPTRIPNVDANGVAFAAIQALKRHNDELARRVGQLEKRLRTLEERQKR